MPKVKQADKQKPTEIKWGIANARIGQLNASTINGN